MNVFGDLTRSITQRPGDPRGAMSYADAMALRDRNRSGQPVDKDKLAEADRIVRETRDRMTSGPQEVQEQPEAAGDAGAPAEDVCVVTGAPGSTVAEMIAKKAAAEATKPYHPKVGSIPWKLYRYLQKHPAKAMSRNEIAAAFGCPANGLDTVLDLAVSRQALVKKRNSKMELTWALGPSKNVEMDEGEWTDPDFSKEAGAIIPRFGRVDPPLKLVTPAPPKTAPALADASIPEGTTSPPSGVSTLGSTLEESSTPVAALPPQSDSLAAQPPAEPPNSRASAAQPGPEAHASVAPARPKPSLAVRASRVDEVFGLDPATLGEAIEPDVLGVENKEIEGAWIAFFEQFGVGDEVEVDEQDAPELAGWRAFFQLLSPGIHEDGGRRFTIFSKRDGVVAMVRVL